MIRYATLPRLAAGLAALALTGCGAEAPDEEADMRLTLGVIADCQYADRDDSGERKYRLASEKLRAAVDDFQGRPLDAVWHLGDFIDRDFESFDVVKPIVAGLEPPLYHVLGNHDYDVADEHKAKVPDVLGVPSPYYDFEMNGFRFVVLDGNEISFHAHPEDSEAHRASVDYYESNDIALPKWNGAIGEEQLAWLDRTLADASARDQPVIIACHYPVYPENDHNLWNAGEVLAIIDRHDTVRAWFNGHNHAGNYAERNGVHYITFKGMLDTEENAYSVVRLTPTHLFIEGMGREEDRTLVLGTDASS
jgi:predicted phosphodiesterase